MPSEVQPSDSTDEYNMANYDNEDAMPQFANDPAPMEDGDEHPQFIDADEEEKEDHQIRSSDSIIVTATAQDEESNLDVYVFDESTSNLYVHHEYMLPAYPLGVEWIPYIPGSGMKKGNFVAVGTFMPQIEIWNLDVCNSVQPDLILGGNLDSEYNPHTQKEVVKGAHTDAVLSMSVHPVLPDLLASGSADTTVKIWDLSTSKCANTLKLHKDRVQQVAWNPKMESALLSADCAGRVVISDINNPKSKIEIKKTSTDLERAIWHPTESHLCMLSFEDGQIQTFDSRHPKEALNKFQAHEKGVTGITINPLNPKILATGSTDEKTKVWDLSKAEPELIVEKNLKIGEILTLKFSEDNPNILAAGGTKGTLGVWDIMENTEIVRRFEGQQEAEKLEKQKVEFKDFEPQGPIPDGSDDDSDGMQEPEEDMED